MKALRAKIGAHRVRTVHGVGYALEPGVTGPPTAPLDPLTSIKVKLGVLVGVSVLLAAVLGGGRPGRGSPDPAGHPRRRRRSRSG